MGGGMGRGGEGVVGKGEGRGGGGRAKGSNFWVIRAQYSTKIRLLGQFDPPPERLRCNLKNI